MGLQPWKLLLDENLDDLLVDARSQHVLKVVHGHQIFDHASERPERLFLRQDVQQASNDEVEALAVSNVDVAVGIGRAHTLNRVQHFLPELLLESIVSLISLLVVAEESFVWESSRHVYFDLMPIRRRIFRIKLANKRVII